MAKKREIDIFGVLLGIVIGCIIGFFLSSRINLDHPPGSGEDVVDTVYGNVFLLQIDKLGSAEAAITLMQSIKNKGLHSISTKGGDYYYVFGAIEISENALNSIKTDFEEKGYFPIVRKEYILDKPNVVLDDSVEYKFWEECITYLLSSLEGKAFIINDTFHINPINLEIYTLIVALQTVQNNKLKEEIRLNVYQELINNLS